MQMDVKIPLRDGAHLSAILYLPENLEKSAPALFTLTPYTAQTYHEHGVYFASHGYPFVAADVRGRGNSEGDFRPFIQEAQDGYDVVAWLAQQAYCNGKVAMWGGSYAGYNQWATAKECPQQLATIVPAASPYLGVDFPMPSNVPVPYLMQWLIYTWGRASQEKVFLDQTFWNKMFQRSFESGVPFKELDSFLGNPSWIFQEWVSHPHQDAYWDRHNPTPEQCARLTLPVLTITGIYDANQPGALAHYRAHLNALPLEARSRQYLVIGPWDHAGTRTPKMEFLGLKFGPNSLVDLPALHLQWYAWTMQGGPQPEFLRQNVAYYVMGAEKWRYAATLEAVTAQSTAFYLHSAVNPTDVFHSGSLETGFAANSGPDHYVYDPRDVSLAEFESTVDLENRAEQWMVHLGLGKQLVYHSAPFASDTEIAGFFKLSAWIALDQPDTDFSVWIYDIDTRGQSILLTTDLLRARYRTNLRQPKLVDTREPLRYDFERFTFVSCLIRKGNRLRLVISPFNSIYSQKNYNSGGIVAEESMKDARRVTVKLFHDEARPSTLYVPLGQLKS
jgi:putative CocE/NonD family hydrolase